MLSAIAATLAIVAIGHLLKRRNFLPQVAWDSITRLCYWVLFPGLLFNLMSTAELNASFVGPFLATLLIGSAIMIGYALLFGRVTGMSGPATGSLLQGSLRHNGFLSLSILQGTFGVSALQMGALAIAGLVPVSNIVSVAALLTLGARRDGRDLKAAIIAEIARNPLLGAIILGLLVKYFQIPVPAFVSQMSVFLGNAALPLLLLCIGASLQFSAFRGHAVPLIGAVVSKLVLFPFVLVSVGWWLGLDALALAVLAATGAAPTASSSYALASELGGDAELMAEIISLQTLFAALSLPLWIWLAGAGPTLLAFS